MKRTISYILIMMIAVLTIPQVAFSATTDFTVIGVNLINQNPDPAYAGDVVDIILGIENMGYGSTSELVFEIEDQYPFTVVSERSLKFNNILSSSTYAQTAKFKLKIDSDAKSGDYKLNIKEYSTSNPSLTKTHSVTISVGSNKNVEILGISKNSISPGAIEEISFKIKNVGNANLKNLEFSWNSKNDILLPVNSDNKIFIYSLKVGEEKEISFNISASSDANAALYKMDLTVSYENQDNSKAITQTSTAGIYVGGESNFDIIFNEVSGSEYVFTIANVGSNDATSVKVSVGKGSDWKTTGKSSEIIGNLNKGDYTSLSFDFDKTGKNLILEVDYTDTSGSRVNTKQNIEIEQSGNMTNTLNRQPRGSGAGAYVSGASTQTSRNPMGGIATGVTTITTWIKYLGYFVVVLAIFVVGYKMNKKRRKN